MPACAVPLRRGGARGSGGITTGLAWTEVGGELLQVEAVLVPGRGRVTVTGKLGDVMQESVTAANAYVRSRANSFGIKPVSSRSATSTSTCPRVRRPRMARRRCCDDHLDRLGADRRRGAQGSRHDRRDQACAAASCRFGGLKEKLLAALRGGLKTVLIPKENERDLPEIPTT